MAYQRTVKSPIPLGPLLDLPTSIPHFIERMKKLENTNKISFNRTHSFTLNLGLGTIVFSSPTWADDL